MKLLLINSIKGLKKKKTQMIGIIFMVLLSTGIYTAMNSSVDRMENRYYGYLDETNTEHFAFDANIDVKKDISKEDAYSFIKKVSDEDKTIVSMYANCLSTSYDMCDNDAFTYGIIATLNKYNLLDEIANEKIAVAAKNKDFTYEKEIAKTVTDKKYTYKVIPLNKDKKMNKPFLLEGKFPTKENEITVLPRFAEKNNLKIGDKQKINDKEYKITGFAFAPDHIYPMLSMSAPMFDEKYNCIIFTKEDTYENIAGLTESIYVGKFNYKVNREDTFEIDEKKLQKEKKFVSKNPAFKVFEEEKDYVSFSPHTILRLMRINALQMEFENNRTFALYFLYVLLTISVVIIVIITKKRIEDERLQIGVLKSLGYKGTQIAVSYLVYPIIGSIIGGILGFLLGSMLSDPVTKIYISFFNLPMDTFKFNLKYLVTSITVPVIVLSILSYLVTIYMLRKKPLDLLKEGSNLKVNKLSKLVNKLTSKLSFESKFRYSLASRSIGKLFIVSVTSFFTGMLIVLVLIGMNLFNSMLDTTFDSFKYKYQVMYSVYETEVSDSDDLLLSSSVEFIKSNDTKLEDKKITLIGLDENLKYLNFNDENEKSLTNLLSHDGVIISKNISNVYKLKVNDKITVIINNEEVEFKVIGIVNELMGSNVYLNRSTLSEILNLKENSYNIKYTNNTKYKDMEKLDKDEVTNIGAIVSIEDMRRNIETQMDTMNYSIYIVIGFASVMAFIIIAVIASIIIEENKKTISLMKVLGYRNKEISKVILNIYTPFVILSYLLSIPAMIYLLKWIIGILTKDIEITIPVAISPVMALVGLTGLLIAYYVAITISRRSLNKVELSVALKRE